MTHLLLQFMFAIMSFDNVQHVDETIINHSFQYVEINDITNEFDNYANLRSTIEICYAINDTQKQIDDCSNYAYIRATTTHV